jgi:putative MFS transporter
MSKDVVNLDVFTEYLNNTRTNANTVKVISAAVLTDMFEFFDFGILSVVLPLWVKQWSLSGIEIGLLSTVVGVGAVIGSFLISALGDRIGRRNAVAYGIIITGISTALISVTPERGVLFVLIMRFLEGIGIGGAYAVDYSLLQEFAPNKLRGFTAGLTSSLIPFGTALAAFAGAFLLPVIGWRPLFLLGLIIVAIAIYMRVQIPETPRFLYVKGKIKESAKSLVWAMGMNPSRDVDKVNEVEQRLSEMSRTMQLKFPKFREQMSLLVSYKREFTIITSLGFVLGFVGYATFPFIPTFLVLNYNMSSTQASLIYAYIYTAASLGRAIASLFTDLTNRLSVLRVLAIANIIFLTGLAFVVGTPLLLLILVPATLAGDNIFPPTMVYANELFPTRVRSTASGHTYAVARIGSILSTFGIGYFLGTPPNIANTAPMWIVSAILYVVYSAIIFSKLVYETKNRSLGL